MSNPVYYIGLDISTQGAKLVVLDYNACAEVFTATVNYDRDLPQYNTVDGHRLCSDAAVSESEPKMWLDAVDILFARLRASDIEGRFVRAISVSGQQHGLVGLDKEGALTRPYAKLWNDTTTEAQCLELTAGLGGREAMLAAVGNVQKPGYTASKILSFKQEDPALFARTETFLLVHNYINYFLTGGVRAMEPGDASGMALMHPASLAWSLPLCQLIDHSLIHKLPQVTSATNFIGKIAPVLAARYGLAEDCLIDAGSGDNMYGAIGSGNVKEGVVTVSLGTSGTAYAFSPQPYAGDDGEVASFCDATGHYLPLVCVANLANGYNQFLKQNGIDHEDFDRLIHQTPAGNEGRLLVPWFSGERTPDLPNAAPTFFGFELADFNPPRLARALLEGHVLNLYEAYCKLPVKGNVVHLTGGLARSAVFRQTIADIFKLEVLPVVGEGAALGAAIHAAWLDQKVSLEGLTRAIVRFDEKARTLPDPGHGLACAQLRAVYRNLSQRLCMQEVDADLFALRKNMVPICRK